MQEKNKALVGRFVDETWNKKDSSKLDDFLAPHFSSKNPLGTIHGVKEYRQFQDSFTRAFPDCKLTIDETIEEGNMVSARCTFTGTHKGDLRGIAPTGKHVKLQVIIQNKISGGKLTEGVSVWDRLSLCEQLGVSAEAMSQALRAAAGN